MGPFKASPKFAASQIDNVKPVHDRDRAFKSQYRVYSMQDCLRVIIYKHQKMLEMTCLRFS